MKIRIKIENKLVKISLVKGNKIIDVATFPEDYNLSEKLLPAIDKLLKKNKLMPQDIKKVITQADTPGSFTTSRIAKAVEKAWNWAIHEV
jgi:tRNA A37 threonylcarbamoyladenosine modification protein TsaB